MKKANLLACLALALLLLGTAAPARAASGEKGPDLSWFLGTSPLQLLEQGGQGKLPFIVLTPEERAKAASPNPPRDASGRLPGERDAEIIRVKPTVINEDENAGGIKVIVNGNQVYFPDQQPYIENGRTMVPIRFVAEALEAQVDCSKDGVVSIDRGDVHIRMKIGESKATVNGVVKTFDAKSVLTKQYRTMVPLRFVSETLGAAVNWDEKTYTVTIVL